MYREKEEYIQLPPMKKDTDPKVVEILWEYVKLSEEAREVVYSDILGISAGDSTGNVTPSGDYQKISHEEIADYEETMKNIIFEVTRDACELACWIYDHKYNLGWTLQEMIQAKPNAEMFIIAMSVHVEEYKRAESVDIISS